MAYAIDYPRVAIYWMTGTVSVRLERELGSWLTSESSMGDESLGFDRDIRVLFRPRDVDSMSFAFDLSSFDDVRTNAEAIYRRLADCSMPCHGRWPGEQVETFRRWIDMGAPP
jgi:hypothetical protein